MNDYFKKVVFGEEEISMIEMFDHSSYDDKVIIHLDTDTFENPYHIDNKYYLPIQNGKFSELVNFSKDHMVHKDDREIVSEFLCIDTMKERLLHSSVPGFLIQEVRQKLIDGSYIYVNYNLVLDMKEDSNNVHFYVYDIHNQKLRELGIHNEHHMIESSNPLTGLDNEETFFQKINQMNISSQTYCLIALDIEHFKYFNEWYGREKGDILLAKIGNILQSYQSDTIRAGYLGQDDFVLFMPFIRLQIDRIYNDIKEAITSYGNSVGFLPSMGIVKVKENIRLFHLYDHALIALEGAKGNYRTRIQVYNESMHEAREQEFQLLNAFQQALIKDELTFFVQPQLNIDSEKIVGAETLVRWKKEDGTFISPGIFIPLLEKSGFITDLDKYIWAKVIFWLRSLLDRGIEPVPVSINVSRVDIFSMNVAEYLYALTLAYNVSPRLVKVEITESAYAEDYDKVYQTIERLREKGFKVFIDDFGSGYSSLNILGNISVDVVKLDMKFLSEENRKERRGISIIESIITMTKTIGLPIIVEGVENKEAARFVHNQGCRYVQGYYYYKPMDVSCFEELLQQEDKVNYDGFKIKQNENYHVREFLDENTFTDTMLNNILGAVGFYKLEGKDLSIIRFNQQFYEMIGDAKMEDRQMNIQNFIVPEDHALFYQMLEDAINDKADGGTCTVRFYKSNNRAYYYYMHLYYLRDEGDAKLFYGQIRNVTQKRQQSTRLFDILKSQSIYSMRINLSHKVVQELDKSVSVADMVMPSMDLNTSLNRTANHLIEDVEERERFIHFFSHDRLLNAYHSGIYDESLQVYFRLGGENQLVNFSVHYTQDDITEDIMVYVFADIAK